MSMYYSRERSEDNSSTRLHAPQAVFDRLLCHSGELIKAIRAENPAILIKCNTITKTLTFVGSTRREAMLTMYEKLKRRGIRYCELKRTAEDVHVWDTRDALRSSEKENEEFRQAMNA